MIKVAKWPRSISWSSFREINARPIGVDENAQINPQINPTGLKVGTDAKGKKYLKSGLFNMIINRQESWVVKGTKSADLLNHEQGHFDILGIYARETVKNIKALRADSVTELTSKLEAMMKQTGIDAEAKDDTYDIETKHGLNAAKQKEWDKRIKDAIKNNKGL